MVKSANREQENLIIHDYQNKSCTCIGMTPDSSPLVRPAMQTMTFDCNSDRLKEERRQKVSSRFLTGSGLECSYRQPF